MKFENIQKGDFVLAKQVVYGFRGKRVFYIPFEVTRTTKTQFTVDGLRYNKATGEVIRDGSHLSVYHLENSRRNDQSKEMHEYKRSSHIYNYCNGVMSEIQRSVNHSMNIDLLKALLPHFDSIDDVMCNFNTEQKERLFLRACGFNLDCGYISEDVKAHQKSHPEQYAQYFGAKNG